MKTIRIRKGLDLPYRYEGNIFDIQKKTSSQISISGYDYPFMPNMLVDEGSSVKRGEFLFTTKDNHSIGIVSPVSGKVISVNRGDKRALVSVSIEVESTTPALTLFDSTNISYSNRLKISETLAKSGAWVYFRTRPFFDIPRIGDEPNAIFVNAMDTRPGSVGMKAIVQGREKYISQGLEILTALTSGKCFFIQSDYENWEGIIPASLTERWEQVVFSGPHPAGLSSTHIHFLFPVSINRKVWTIPVNLVADIGELWSTGFLPNKTRVNLSGPYWKDPQIWELTLGSRLSTLLKDKIHLREEDSIQKKRSEILDNYRIVSGSILHGWEAKDAWDMLGRFHNQISLIRNDSKREFLDWLLPGFRKFSITRSTFGRFFPRRIIWNTSMNGSPRALVSIGNYERVMPLDILPTQLLRALLTKDWEEAIELGALELEEEDLSLISYVCPGKMDFGSMLKETLKIAKKELV